ncbi:MAG: hypothetical protein JO066_08300 [Verrucomicrobia bacterium]|nr:hypothetical protein [Verrucomicrobiota bacterium]
MRLLIWQIGAVDCSIIAIAAALINIYALAAGQAVRFMKKMPGIFFSYAAGVTLAASLVVTTLRGQVVQKDP